MLKNRLLVLITSAIVIVGITSFYLFHSGEKLSPKVSIDTTQQPLLGNPNAPVQIVAFEDLKCGNCKMYNNTIFPSLQKNLIDTGKANYTLVLVAFIPGSVSAANAALCLYHQNKEYFFPFVAYLYQNQPDEHENWTTIPQLLQMTQQSIPQADREALSNCIFESRYTDRISSNLKQAFKIMNGEVATPAVYVNGHLVEPLTIERIQELAK